MEFRIKCTEKPLNADNKRRMPNKEKKGAKARARATVQFMEV